ncbi:hypothetical protein [Thalassobacillus hwangdonensis]|uniref:Uncharacterized protein n=1 Tax=Thalassobacillus hwangdonensis TaxID=546108 RepID=A0ABW3KZ91_9BACI
MEKKTRRAQVQTNEQAEIFSRRTSYNRAFTRPREDHDDHLMEGEMMTNSLLNKDKK